MEVKRIVYEDEEGDSCTLTAPSFSDALDLCSDGVLRLQVVPGPGEGTYHCTCDSKRLDGAVARTVSGP